MPRSAGAAAVAAGAIRLTVVATAAPMASVAARLVRRLPLVKVDDTGTASWSVVQHWSSGVRQRAAAAEGEGIRGAPAPAGRARAAPGQGSHARRGRSHSV